MSKKANKATRTNLPRRNRSTPLALSADPEVPGTTGNYRNIEISALTFKQQSSLPIVAVSRTVAQASRDSGVSEKTLRKWLEDPSFRT